MNEEELSAAVTELQATNKSLQSQHTEILKTSQLIRLQMEEMTMALRSLAQQMGASTSVRDGLAGGYALRNSDLVLVGRRSDGSQQASSDPNVQTQPATLLMPLKRLVVEDEVAGVEDEDDDVSGEDYDDTDTVAHKYLGVENNGVVMIEPNEKSSLLKAGLISVQIEKFFTDSLANQVGGEVVTAPSNIVTLRRLDSVMEVSISKEEAEKTEGFVGTSRQPLAKLWEKLLGSDRPPPWPPPPPKTATKIEATAATKLCVLRWKREAKSLCQPMAYWAVLGLSPRDADYSRLGFQELMFLVATGPIHCCGPICFKEFSWNKIVNLR